MGSTPSLDSLSAFPEFELPVPEYDKRLDYDMAGYLTANTSIAAPSTSHSQLSNNNLVSENTPVAHLRQGQQTETYSEQLQCGQGKAHININELTIQHQQLTIMTEMIPAKSTDTPQHGKEPKVTISGDIRQGQGKKREKFKGLRPYTNIYNRENPNWFRKDFSTLNWVQYVESCPVWKWLQRHGQWQL